MGRYETKPVTFQSHGVKLVGRLFTPIGGGNFPAISVLGPVAFVKEQAPIQYGTRLAQNGFVTLIFDPRNHGESEGEPRRHESITMKTEDVEASMDFLATQPKVDPNRIAVLGICQGASTGLNVAGRDNKCKALVTVTGNYLTKQWAVTTYGGEEAYNDRVKRADDAKKKYEADGTVDYLPIVDPKRKDVMLPRLPPYLFYQKWIKNAINGSTWENRYTVMSEAESLRYDCLEKASKVTKPWLMVHADYCDNPANGKAVFEKSPSAKKQLVWMGQAMHMQFYEEPMVLDSTVGHIVDYLEKNI